MKYTLSSGLIVTDIYVQGINGRDYPDFSDAYIESASVLEYGDWRDATDHENYGLRCPIGNRGAGGLLDADFHWHAPAGRRPSAAASE